MDEQNLNRIAAAWGMIKLTLKEYGAVQTMTILHDANDSICVLPPLRENRKEDHEEHAQLILKAAAQYKAVFVLMAGEAWYATVPKGEAATKRVKPSEHPSRIEVVIVSWKSITGESGIEVRRLVRTKMYPIVGDRIPFNDDPRTLGFDRFFDRLFVTPQ